MVRKLNAIYANDKIIIILAENSKKIHLDVDEHRDEEDEDEDDGEDENKNDDDDDDANNSLVFTLYGKWICK